MAGEETTDLPAEDTSPSSTMSVPTPASNANGKKLPFPSRFDGRGQPEIELLSLENLTVKTLRSYCRQFELKVSGAKETLHARLEAFSQDREAWDRHCPGARKSHKGPRAIVKSSEKNKRTGSRQNLKLSSKRLAYLRGKNVDHASVKSPSMENSVVERSKDLRTPQEIDEVLPWAQVISTTHPYMAETVTEVIDEPATSGMLPWQTGSTISTVSSQIAQQVSTEIMSQLRMQAVATNPTTQCCAPAEPEASHDHESLVHPLSHKPVEDAGNVMRHLKLGDQTTVSFSISSIPDPVAVTFVQDIPRLNAMWDDTSSHWEGESVLTIEGHPIPVVYWREIYRYGKVGQWQGMKSRWTDWKDIIHRYRQSTPENFWGEFSVDGHRMSFTAVVAELRRQRKNNNQHIVALARKEFGELFDSNFSYRKGGDSYVMADASAIARQYQRLKEEQLQCEQ